MSLSLDCCYRLAGKARLRWDPTRSAPFLLYPERGLALNAVAFAIVSGCDGATCLSAVLERVADDFGVARAQVKHDARPFLGELVARGLLVEVAS